MTVQLRVVAYPRDDAKALAFKAAGTSFSLRLDCARQTVAQVERRPIEG